MIGTVIANGFSDKPSDIGNHKLLSATYDDFLLLLNKVLRERDSIVFIGQFECFPGIINHSHVEKE